MFENQAKARFKYLYTVGLTVLIFLILKYVLFVYNSSSIEKTSIIGYIYI